MDIDILHRIIRRIAWLGKALLVGLALFLALGAVELLINRLRGYQLVTLKTRMYWDNGEAVVGEKIKTWKIAIPVDIWLGGNVEAWSLFTWHFPVYSSRREDLGYFRYVNTLTNALLDNTLVPSGKGGSTAIGFPLTFSNKIAGTAAGAEGYPAQSITDGCVVGKQFVNYHGWMVRVRPNKIRDNSATGFSPVREVSDERICAIALKNLDKWTLHIDDLQSKDSGQ